MTEYKNNPAKSPLGSLPVLELPQGTFVQCTALGRWAAKKSDLYPTNEIDQLIVDEVMETMNEFLDKVGNDKVDTIRKALREKFATTIMPKYMNLLTNRVQKSGGPFILGRKISIGDLFVFSQLDALFDGRLEFISAEDVAKKYPVVHKLFLDISNHAIVKAELAVKPAVSKL